MLSAIAVGPLQGKALRLSQADKDGVRHPVIMGRGATGQ